MKIRSAFWLVLFILVAAAGPATAGMRNVSAAEASDLLKKKTSVFLLDVRTPEEYRQVRLQGARLIPIDQFLRRLNEVPKDQPVLVYCAVGSRSFQVAEYLSKLGYPEVYNLYGGIWGWQLRGLPVLQGGP